MKPHERFKPMSDGQKLREANDAAWSELYESKFGSRMTEIGERIAQHLESLYPASDMAVLKKYGCTGEVSSVCVRIATPDKTYGWLWRETARVELPRDVVVASSFSHISSGGPRYSRDPERGIKGGRKAYEKMGYGTWEDLCADQDKKERERMPEDLEPFFTEMVAERKRYHEQYEAAREWPKQYRSEQGKYPTWAEIAEKFPVLGAYLLKTEMATA